MPCVIHDESLEARARRISGRYRPRNGLTRTETRPVARTHVSVGATHGRPFAKTCDHEQEERCVSLQV